MIKNLPIITLSMAAIGITNFPSPYYNREIKQNKKCLLKECNNLTNHNGGYCSKECCKIDKNKIN